MDELSLGRIAEFGVWFVVFLFSTTLHEAGHALFAHLGGDDTAYRGGQVSLNPLPHVQREPFGMILVPIMSFLFMGWMMGWASTPYDPYWAQRHPRRQALMSAAGPGSNFLLAAAAFAVLWVLLGQGVLVAPQQVTFSHLAEPAPSYGPDSLWHPTATALSVALSLNLLLFVFNLFPLPPLDGSGVLRGLFPVSIGPWMARISSNPMLSILGLLVAWQLFPPIFVPALRWVLELLHPGVYGL